MTADSDLRTRETIRAKAHALGFDVCRFTTAAPPHGGARFRDWLDRSCHGEMGYLERTAGKRMSPELVLPGVRSVVCLAASYFTRDEAVPAPDETSAQGRVARYARFADYHHILGARLGELSALINTLGNASKSIWYVDTGPILEREFAQRAGVGFIGKHTNLISRNWGNWTVLAEILTTLELEPDAPERNRCGTCTSCLEACPTRAITAPFQLDARLCISYQTIENKGAIPVDLRPLVGDRIFGCDDCLAVCPWNRFARIGEMMRPHARPEHAAPRLIELLQLDEPTFRHRFRDTPLLRTRRRGLRRNVCVALGNIGNESALPVLERVANLAEPVVAEHARWAIDRIAARLASSSGD